MKNSSSLMLSGYSPLALLAIITLLGLSGAKAQTNISGSLSVGGVNTNTGLNSVAIGNHNTVTATNGLAVGFLNVVSGSGAVAMGSSTSTGADDTAFGTSGAYGVIDSTFGIATTATNDSAGFAANNGNIGHWYVSQGGSNVAYTGSIQYSTAFNHGFADATYSFAANYGEADNQYSAAFGCLTVASGPCQFVVGQFNMAVGPGTNSPTAGQATTTNSTNALFIIGNGTAYGDLNNAMMVRMDGLVLINPSGDVSMGSYTHGVTPNGVSQ